jgi:hypothetical protein
MLLPNLALRTKHGIVEVLTIDLPLFFGTTLSIASFYIMSEREIAILRGGPARIAWNALRRLPLVMSLGIGLCVNQTRAVLEALMGRETEFVRTPKHGIRGKLESWSSKKYRAAKSITPFIEVALAAYFLEAMIVAFQHGHYLSMPFLALFLCGFGYVGVVSVWQGSLGQFVRDLTARKPVIVTPPALPVLSRPARATDTFDSAFATTLDDTESMSVGNPTAAV